MQKLLFLSYRVLKCDVTAIHQNYVNMEIGLKPFQAARVPVITMATTIQEPGSNPHEAWCEDLVFGTITLRHKNVTSTLWYSVRPLPNSLSTTLA